MSDFEDIRRRRYELSQRLRERWEKDPSDPVKDIYVEKAALDKEEEALRAAEPRTAQSFSDSEYTVIIDSLAHMRDELRDGGLDTPTIDSALAKLHTMARPEGCEFIAFWGEDRELLSRALVGGGT